MKIVCVCVSVCVCVCVCVVRKILLVLQLSGKRKKSSGFMKYLLQFNHNEILSGLFV